MPVISPQAIVERGAKLADDVKVGPFSYIGPHVRIGAGCIIDNNVSITGKTVVGERTHVHPMAVIGASAAGAGTEGECIIGKANTLREQITIYGGHKAPTRLGDDNLLMIASQVGPSAVIGDHGIFANCMLVGGSATVEDYVRSSAFAVVEEGVTLGAYTFVAGYVSVDRDAPPFAIIQGFPFRVRGVNSENLKRCGFGETDIRSLKDAFRELFDNEGLNVNEDALRRFQAVDSNPHIGRLVAAIQAGRSRRRRR